MSVDRSRDGRLTEPLAGHLEVSTMEVLNWGCLVLRKSSNEIKVIPWFELSMNVVTHISYTKQSLYESIVRSLQVEDSEVNFG